MLLYVELLGRLCTYYGAACILHIGIWERTQCIDRITNDHY